MATFNSYFKLSEGSANSRTGTIRGRRRRMFGIVPRPTVRSISCARPAILWIPIPGPVVCHWGVDKSLVTIGIIKSTLLIQWFSTAYSMFYFFEWLIKGFQQFSMVYLNIRWFPLLASSASRCQAVHCALVQQVLLGAKASGQRVH